MTQAAGRSGRDVWRVAASGDPVEMTLPALLGDFRWYGNTRFTGPRLARQFFLAPAGEHEVIPEKILPGGRQVRRTMRGYDAVVFEAADRSDSALVLAGPYNEATTWFGGPAPTAAGIERLLRTFRFPCIQSTSTGIYIRSNRGRAHRLKRELRPSQQSHNAIEGNAYLR